MLENFRNTELRRVQLERQLVDSRLATQEAQIDPAMLFDRLAHVKTGLEHGSEGAEEQLNELIQTLRTSLKRMVSSQAPATTSSP